ncbi:MAG TPA: hypothetical protein VN775_13400 [Opitutaceae bacterium]|nr:hypothetical protein [Opitutaceae bacterium]
MRRCALAIVALLVGGCASETGGPRRSAVDEGYLLGAADAVKQLYWAKQALEAPRGSRPAGRTEYYVWEESGTARDGRKLAPETVAVPVFVPAPAAAAGP